MLKPAWLGLLGAALVPLPYTDPPVLAGTLRQTVHVGVYAEREIIWLS